MEMTDYGFWLGLVMTMMGQGDAPPTFSEMAVPGAMEQAAHDLVWAVENGDTATLTYALVEAYKAAGASPNDGLAWQLQSYDGIVNWYNDITEVINLSELAADDEVTPYWDNWSKVLTGGRWDWEAFFSSDDEARDMARFNQLVLGAHEFGHALTYRYDPDHVSREDEAVNCRELAADRLTAGLLEELADLNPAIAGWRLRYGELAAAINAEIAPTDRYEAVAYADLDADCHLMHVAQPDETSMTPYASAYFARWQGLLAADLPPLAELYQTHLFPHWQARLVPAAPLAAEVQTVQWLEEPVTGTFERGDETGWHLPAFAPDGRLFVMDYVVRSTDEKIGLFIAYGPAGNKKKVVLDTQTLAAEIIDPMFFDLQAFLPLGSERFLVASADIWGDETSLVLLDFERTQQGWRHRLVQPLPDQQHVETRLRQDETGGIWLDVYEMGSYSEGSERQSGWLSFPLDLQTLTLGAAVSGPDGRYEWFSTMADGRAVLLDHHNPALLLDTEDGVVRIAGNGLEGYKEAADPLAVEFFSPLAAIGLGDTIRVLDIDPYYDQATIRDVRLRQ
ncbi:MAG: hypothetical protein KIT02_12755 [Devosia sp.]|uniref:hypothetical protein n=1 Tax=Devosia sp. TaxID=1871048 RepID=UPI0024CD3818|nr:hypothetical protein [Devosia sp.]UYN98802.1 MAG: hypothetical protein KIT02_12755 [Devosia sp.]